jgi:hypothetical protein
LEKANFVHDLGMEAAKLKHYLAAHKENDRWAKTSSAQFLWHYNRNLGEV